MKRALAVLVVVLLATAFAVAFLVKVGTANPFFPSGSWSDEPDKPIINLLSPQENQNLTGAVDVWLNFTVTVPKTKWYSGADNFATTFGNITSTTYSVDGKPPMEVSASSEEYGVLSFAVNLGLLPDGSHTILISAEGYGYCGNIITDLYAGSTPSFMESVSTVLVSNFAEVDFVVGNVLQTALMIATITIAPATAFGLLFYFKKCRSGSGAA
jgi:hypothetical protein